MRLGIRAKLFGGFGAVLILLGIVAAVGYRNTVQSTAEFADLYENRFQPAVQLAKSHARSPRALSRGETSVLVLDFPYSRLTIANLASPPRRAPCGVWPTQPRPMPGCWPIALPYPHRN